MVKDTIMLAKNISKTCGIICVLALLMVPISFAEGLHVYREYPSSAKMGATIQVNITVENQGNFGIPVTIQENVGDYTVIAPNPIVPKGVPGIIGLRLPYFEWNVTVNPLQNKTVYYQASLTSPGEIMLSPTIVIAENETIYGTPGSIRVICNENGECEANLSENYLTCDSDCPTGADDGLCDLIEDGRCDPDCSGGFDVDCLTPEDPNETASGEENEPEEPAAPLLETYWWLIPVVLIILVGAYIFLKKRSKPKEKSEWQAAYESAPSNP